MSSSGPPRSESPAKDALRVGLVDDEPLARRVLRRHLSEHRNVSIVGEASTVEEAARLARAEKPDALFLDIGLPDAEGFALFGELDPTPAIVFVTAYREHAVRAFEVGAVDYLLKPVAAERLATCLRRLAEVVAAGTQAPTAQPGELISLRTPARSVITPLKDIVALLAEGDFTRVLVAGQNPLLICRTLGSFATTLPDPPFAKLDRSLIVNSERLRSVEAQGRNAALLRLAGAAEPLSLGRAASQRLRQLQKRLAG